MSKPLKKSLMKTHSTKGSVGVFIHIPKAGGSSVYSELAKIGIHRYSKHNTALYVKNRVDPSIWQRWYKVSWVRNPWQRAFSEWKYTLLHNKSHDIDNFKKWLLESREVGRHLETDYPQRNPISALTYLSDLDDNLLVDFVGRMEHMAEDLRKICENLGLPNTLKERHMNKRRLGMHYLKNYDEETHDYIEKVCAWEIEKFGYKFEK